MAPIYGLREDTTAMREKTLRWRDYGGTHSLTSRLFHESVLETPRDDAAISVTYECLPKICLLADDIEDGTTTKHVNSQVFSLSYDCPMRLSTASRLH